MTNFNGLYGSKYLGGQTHSKPDCLPLVKTSDNSLLFPFPGSGLSPTYDHPLTPLSSGSNKSELCDQQSYPKKCLSTQNGNCHPQSAFAAISTKPDPRILCTEIHSCAGATTPMVTADPGSVVLQPPSQSLSKQFSQASRQTWNTVVPPQTIHPAQPGRLSLPYDCWSSDQNVSSFMSSNMLDTTCGTFHRFFSSNSSPNGDIEDTENDPFAQLSARTLALMDQPESEVTIYDCEYCDKAYQGKHARSIWRRHLSDKHKIPLATQPRRTRWDNDANRPKTEEERRERTLESKRRWARKNRAAKKAARESQRSENEIASNVRQAESKPSASRAESPNRSRAPSPASFTPSLSLGPISVSGEINSGTQRRASEAVLSGSPLSTQKMLRGSSAPHDFTSCNSDELGASVQPSSLGYVNQSFPLPYPFPAYASMQSYMHPAQFRHEEGPSLDLQSTSNQSPRHHSLPPSYAVDAKREPFQLLHHQAELIRPPQLHSAPYVPTSEQFQGGGWSLDGRFEFGVPEVTNFQHERPADYQCDSVSKRPRLSESLSHLSVNQNQRHFRRQSSLASHESRGTSEAPVRSGSILSTHMVSAPDIAQLDLQSSSQSGSDDTPAGSTSLVDAEDTPSNVTTEPAKETPSFSIPTNSSNKGSRVRPLAVVGRAATEPQVSFRSEVQTPAREAFFNAASRMHFGISPLRHGTDGESSLDAIDLFSSPADSRNDTSFSSIYHSHFAPTSASKRRTATENCQSLVVNSSGGTAQYSSPSLQTPGFSRFGFGTGMIPSPGGNGIFGSPHSNLTKTLGLAPNGLSGAADDCLGSLLLGNGSSWEFFNHRNS